MGTLIWKPLSVILVTNSHKSLSALSHVALCVTKLVSFFSVEFLPIRPIADKPLHPSVLFVLGSVYKNAEIIISQLSCYTVFYCGYKSFYAKEISGTGITLHRGINNFVKY
jgi:hypothetical protein